MGKAREEINYRDGIVRITKELSQFLQTCDCNCLVYKNVFTGIKSFDLCNSPVRAAKWVKSLSQEVLASK